MLYLSGIVIAFFLGFLLLLKRNKSYADKLLALWLFVIGIHQSYYYLHFTNNTFNYPFLLGLEQPIPLLHGPFLFLYVHALTSPRLNWKKDLLHFIPFFLGEISVARFVFQPSAVKIAVYKSGGAGYELLELVFLISIILSGIIYSILSFRRLLIHQRLIGEYFSNTEKITLRWLKYLIIGLGGIWVMVIFGNDDLIFTGVVFYLLFIGYFGINQVGIFTSNKIREVFTDSLKENAESVKDEIKPSDDIRSAKLKYEKSGVDGIVLSDLHSQLIKLMSEEKLFKTSELVLTDVAGKLHVHPNVLSQVINTIEGKNFFNYINELRIEEFKRMVVLPESHRFTLLSLAYDCGFNSKTAFNRNFKKVVGLSPTEYLEQVRIDLKPE